MEDELEVLDEGTVESENEGTVESEVTETPKPESTETPEPSEEETPEVDPNKLPPELQKLYKGFQSSYTKKMQALQEAMDALTPHKDRLALIDKAISGDKEAMATLARIAGAQQPPSEAKETKEYSYEDVPEAFEDTKSLMKFMDSRFNAALNNFAQYFQSQVLPQHLQPVQQLREESEAKAVQAQIAEMRSKYPDFDSKVKQIIEIRKENPGIGLEAAYKLSTWAPKVSAQKIVAKPGARPGAMTAKEPKGPVSWETAFKLATERSGRS